MRGFATLVCLFLLSSASAHADDKAEVEKLVRKQLAAFDSIDATLASNAKIRQVKHSPDTHSGTKSPTFHRLGVQPTFAPGAITVTVLDDVAWFHGVGTFTLKSTDKKPITETRTIRVNGLAAKRKNTWLAVGELFAIAVDDKAIVEDAKKVKLKAPDGPAILNGDKTLARAIERWLTSRVLGKHAARAPNIVASGASPTEHKTCPAAIALAANWDKLKLLPIEIEAVLYSPTTGFVLADVALVPAKGGPPIHLVLGAVLIKEDEAWKWVSLSWSPDQWFPKPELVAPESEDADPCGD